ncbi:MAG TPA: hypothetical protein VK966_09895 [Longimicrobiales bacterium]|nr:hypothetical protein [Longimicrobiales bacterium]
MVPEREGAGKLTQLAWYAGAAAVGIVLALVFLLPGDGDRSSASPSGVTPAPGAMAGQGGGPGVGAPGSGGPGPLSGDMRTNADRLFNRVMTAAQQENRAEVEQFMPMAIQAYQMVEDLDVDGTYHLALLQMAAGRFQEAQATAAGILEAEPNHLLALGVSAEAAAAAGDSAAATDLYTRLMDGYAEEAERPLQEYQEHPQMLPRYRRAAETYLAD